MKPVWSSRTGSGLDARFAAFSDSTPEDAAFLPHDVQGSIAHVRGLAHAELLAADEAEALVAALETLLAEHQEGTFTLDPALEDGHMNLEAALTDRLGAVGRKIHTGRSRNDQVATCIVLYAREALVGIAEAAHALAGALATQAEAHKETPWVATTHGQPAQPATLGFLLAAHAFRAQDAARLALWTADHIAESPLGSGAVAGSTLPLDPAYTARLLGLRPPRNALLATGTRDALWATLQATTQAGRVAAGLAQDLLGLFGQAAMRLPAGLTTGSSLMPQKRNPDVLELVRGKALALKGHEDAVFAATAGLGLGYMRDLQATKPHLHAACTDAQACLEMITAAASGATFDAAVLAESLAAPGITATDAAEALVRTGMPFRDAYSALANALHAQEEGTALEEALAAQGLTPAQVDAVQEALAPDPARRATLGGPAPQQVEAALDQIQDEQTALQEEIASAHATAPQGTPREQAVAA